MKPKWFKSRRYKHFDRPVGEAFAAKAMQTNTVLQHSFSPLIHYNKQTKRYKKFDGKTVIKNRPIMYASHRDACILSFYSAQLNEKLNSFYYNNKLDDHIIAYRSLGQANYDFSAVAFHYAVDHAPCTILAFDVSGFFDNLDHKFLKDRLKRILGLNSLPDDWHRIFRFCTKFHYVEQDELKEHPQFAEALSGSGTNPIASIAELKAAGVQFFPNSKHTAGIPQGTPISATLSNLYLMDFDIKVRNYCENIGAFYRRYSDDILIICPNNSVAEVEAKIGEFIADEKLSLSKEKTELTEFDPSSLTVHGLRCAQYLGFMYYPGGAGIRPSSLSNQWRRMRRSVRRTRKIAEVAIATGKVDMAFTKKLRRRFSPLQFRNFSSYARRSAKAFGPGEKISTQVKRFEREFERQIQELKTL